MNGLAAQVSINVPTSRPVSSLSQSEPPPRPHPQHHPTHLLPQLSSTLLFVIMPVIRIPFPLFYILTLTLTLTSILVNAYTVDISSLDDASQVSSRPSPQHFSAVPLHALPSLRRLTYPFMPSPRPLSLLSSSRYVAACGPVVTGAEASGPPSKVSTSTHPSFLGFQRATAR